jgi:hypothetical protein
MNIQCCRQHGWPAMQGAAYSYKLFKTVQLFLSKQLPLSSKCKSLETDSCHEKIMISYFFGK